MGWKQRRFLGLTPRDWWVAFLMGVACSGVGAAAIVLMVFLMRHVGHLPFE
jgi:hypothetical protein